MPPPGLQLQRAAATQTCSALAPVGLRVCRVSFLLLGIPSALPRPLHLMQGQSPPGACISAMSHFMHLRQGQAFLPHCTPLLQGQAAPAVSPAQRPVRSATTPSGKGWTSQSQPPPCSCGWQMGRAWWHASTTPRLWLTSGASLQPPGKWICLCSCAQHIELCKKPF